MNITFKVEKRIVKSISRVITIGDYTVDFDSLAEVIEGLSDTSAGFNAISINDDRIEKLLISLEVASKNARGSCNKGRNFEDFQNKISEMEEELDKVPDPLSHTHHVTRLGTYQRDIVNCDFPATKKVIREKMRMSESHFAVSIASLVKKKILIEKGDTLIAGPNFKLVRK